MFILRDKTTGYIFAGFIMDSGKDCIPSWQNPNAPTFKPMIFDKTNNETKVDVECYVARTEWVPVSIGE